jgi:hypothetical protein
MGIACAVAAVVAIHIGRAAAEPTNDDCLACHGSGALTGDDGRSLTVSPEPFAASAHGALPCVLCHADAGEIPHPQPPKRVGLDTCAACHGDVVAAYGRGIHAQRSGAPPGATCRDCHGEIHGVRPHADPASVAHWSHLVTACARCHADRSVVNHGGIAIVQPVDAYLAGVHGRAVANGTRAAVCSDRRPIRNRRSPART